VNEHGEFNCPEKTDGDGMEAREGKSEKDQERMTVAEAASNAARQLAALLQCDAVSVSSINASDKGWSADVEIVEIQRVPDTTSVMATYGVQLDGSGRVLGYERKRRYARGQLDR
jgi:hypothetical protein